MLLVLGCILTFVILFIVLWDKNSEFLWPTIYVTMFCFAAGAIIERFL